jgi:hypothetical protein
MTDTEQITLKSDFLQLAAKLLPETLVFYTNPRFPQLATFRFVKTGIEIQDEHMLHICHLIEQGMTEAQRDCYIRDLVTDDDGTIYLEFGACADWPSRAEAIVKVYANQDLKEESESSE